MSMPKFPEFDPEMTCEHSLNMILASIAMEELALSHILNAEGEKLQYILGTLETGGSRKPCPDEVLAVNQSITCLLDSVAQNQMILKSKMDRALHALSEICPRPPRPPCPPIPPCPPKPGCKCSATFKAARKCRIWCPDAALHWEIAHPHGECVRIDPDDKTKIKLCAKGRFVVHFSVNVKSEPDCKGNAAIRLQAISKHERRDIYTVRTQISADTIATMSMDGIIIDTLGDCAPDSLMFRLVSPDALAVCDSMLSVIQI